MEHTPSIGAARSLFSLKNGGANSQARMNLDLDERRRGLHLAGHTAHAMIGAGSAGLWRTAFASGSESHHRRDYAERQEDEQSASASLRHSRALYHDLPFPPGKP